MNIEKKCPFCSNVTNVNVDDNSWKNYLNGVPILHALNNVNKFDREVVISGICHACQEKVFHTPTPEHAKEWGKSLGECPNCGCEVYLHKDKKEDGSYQCNGCCMPLKYNSETDELEEDI